MDTTFIDLYLDMLAAERGAARNTLDAYRRDLALLVAYCEEHGIDDWNALHLEQMRAFVAAQHRRGLAPASLQRLLSACRSFFRWQQKQGTLKVDPTTGLRAPKAGRKLPQVLDADEVAQLVEVDVNTPIDARDRIGCQRAPGGVGQRNLFRPDRRKAGKDARPRFGDGDHLFLRNVPDFPPLLCSRRISERAMSRSTALHMS